MAISKAAMSYRQEKSRKLSSIDCSMAEPSALQQDERLAHAFLDAHGCASRSRQGAGRGGVVCGAASPPFLCPPRRAAQLGERVQQPPGRLAAAPLRQEELAVPHGPAAPGRQGRRPAAAHQPDDTASSRSTRSARGHALA